MRSFKLGKLNIDKQRGIGLLELMLALAIIAILLVMATRYFITTSRSEQVNRAVNQIGAINGAVSNWKSSRVDYTGLDAKALNDIGAIPAAEWNGTAIVSPWGTDVTVGPAAGGEGAGADNSRYSITYSGIPTWACASLEQKYTTALAENATAEVTGTCTGNTTFTYTSP